MRLSPWLFRAVLLGSVVNAFVLSACKNAPIEEAHADIGTKPVELSAASQNMVLARTVPAPASKELHLEDALAYAETVRVGRELVHFRRPNSPCAGHYTEAPTFRLTLTEEATLRIGAEANNRQDMTLAIERADGHWLCNDDWHDRSDPGLIARLPAGTHDVYFGAYAQLRDLDYQPSFSLARIPAWERCDGGEVQTLAPGDSITLGNRLSDDMHGCQWLLDAPNCAWSIPGTPALCFDLTEPAVLEVSTRNADFDTALVVQEIVVNNGVPKAGQARLFNDDQSAMDTHSRVEALTRPGRYAIFVGSYRHRTSGTFEVHVRAEIPETP